MPKNLKNNKGIQNGCPCSFKPFLEAVDEYEEAVSGATVDSVGLYTVRNLMQSKPSKKSEWKQSTRTYRPL